MSVLTAGYIGLCFGFCIGMLVSALFRGIRKLEDAGNLERRVWP